MCMCKHPNVNGTPNGYSWDGKSTHTRPVDPPALEPDDGLLHDEPGRCVVIDSHCHHFRVVTRLGGIRYLLVRHGGGDERYTLDHHRPGLAFIDHMSSTSRYWFLHTLYRALKDASNAARDTERFRWTASAIAKKIKVRKRKGRTYVEIIS